MLKLFKKNFCVGDRVVYRKTKRSSDPGPRAEEIIPARRGDDYSYCVDKYWLITELPDDQQTVIVETRGGKKHTLQCHDPNLRHANWWERRFLSKRFPGCQTDDAQVDQHSNWQSAS